MVAAVVESPEGTSGVNETGSGVPWRAVRGVSGASACASSRALWERRAGSFSRQRETIAAYSGGASVSGAGAWYTIFIAMSASVSPGNGDAPDTRLCKITPSDQTSLRGSAFFADFTLSGDM